MLWGLRRCGSRKSGGQTSVCLSKARADAPKHRSGRVERCLVRLGVNGLGFTFFSWGYFFVPAELL